MSNGTLSENAIKVAESRYFMEGEDWEKLCERVGSVIAEVEGEKSNIYSKKFSEMIYNLDFIPGGRILRNAGRRAGSLFNCYALRIGDSREEIGTFYKDSLILWGEGGGCGINISPLRPQGAPIKRVGGFSSGPVSFLKASDAIAETIESGGSRRAAAIALMSVEHPDIEKFIDAKLKDGVLPHYNISVAITNDFLEAVEKDSEWELKFSQKSYGKVKARKLWNKIIKNMILHAEPGLLNWDNFIKNNSYYYDPVICSNPCQPDWATVLTKNGISTIADINIGDEIWSKDGWTTVRRKIDMGEKEVYRYRTTSSVFYGTKEHKIVSNDDKIEVDNAESIDSIKGYFSEDIELIPEVIMDGIVLGDGSVHKASNNLVHLYIGKHDQDYFDSEIAHLITKHRPGLKDTAYEIKTNISYDELPHTYNRRVPKRYLFGSRNVVASFLRGLYSANGSVINDIRQKARIQLRTTSKNIVEDVQLMLSSLGIRSYYTTDKRKKVKFRNGEYECKESYTINITFDRERFYSLIGFIQKYKNRKLLKSINIPYSKKYNKRIKKTFDIVDKKFISKEKVFNITVDNESHTYWSGGCDVGNCSEAVLSAYDVCDLGSLVLPNFISGTSYTNWKKLEETIKIAIRFLDNVIDVNKYILPIIDSKAHNSRRIGLGVMGLAEYLFAKNLRYGSEKALVEIEKLVKFIRDIAYKTTVELSIEKGSFPKFDPIQYGKASFIRKLPATLRMDIKQYGVRNVTCLAYAPTGSISLLVDVTSGIEPLFRKAYLRHDRVGDRMYIHLLYKKFLENNTKIPEWYVDTDDLKPQDHLETQAVIQKYVDGAISKTLNMQKGTTIEELSRYLLEYIYDLKGCTVYVDGSREGQILNPISKKEAKDYIQKNKTVNFAGEESIQCARGSCEI